MFYQKKKCLYLKRNMKISLNPININNYKISFKSKNNSYEDTQSFDKIQDSLNEALSVIKKVDKNSTLHYEILDLLDEVWFYEQDFSKGNDSMYISSEEQFASFMAKVKNVLSRVQYKSGQNILGQDLLKKTHDSKIPLPFELGDKKLILDDYQKRAVNEFKKGNTVLITAPTGTGKTLIAEHVINDILKSGKKVIYTTPLKALCNDKYKQFSILWGDYKDGKLVGNSKVGLATGDVKINLNAPLVVMTTEIYRNMLVQQEKEAVEQELKDVEAVIFDEFHYMGDDQRGSVWEESVMFSPDKMKFLMLSATIANASPIRDWLSSINKIHKTKTVNVPEEERFVPLKHYVYCNMNNKFGFYDFFSEKFDLNGLKKRSSFSTREEEVLDEIAKKLGEKDGITALDKLLSGTKAKIQKITTDILVQKLREKGFSQQKAEQYAIRLADKSSRRINENLYRMREFKDVPLADLINQLKKNDMTPALYFTYSKKNCYKNMKDATKFVNSLLTVQEQQEVKKRINELQQKGIFLGANFEKEIKPCLLKGIAMHHSGMMPQCKSFIEELGRNKLIKVCFATDTLGAGINFPFKTVVFSDFVKYGNMGYEEISTNTFKQGAGRAGRRGIDDIGYVISIPKMRKNINTIYDKITNSSEDINSAFSLSYGLVLSPRFLNNSEKVLDSSFETFQKMNFKETDMKNKYMQAVLKERDFIIERDNKYILTQKGHMASKIRGVNEILLTEILLNDSIMKNITPLSLASLVSMFAPDYEEKIISNEIYFEKGYSQKERDVIKLAQEIKEVEEKNNIESNIKINNVCSEYIYNWATIQSNSKHAWSDLINDMISKRLIKSEGDFFKKVNYTINVLKQIEEVAPNEKIKQIAGKSIKLLQKSPVNDILLYELDLKENNE